MNGRAIVHSVCNLWRSFGKTKSPPVHIAAERCNPRRMGTRPPKEGLSGGKRCGRKDQARELQRVGTQNGFSR
jgi:hypothetical protein